MDSSDRLKAVTFIWGAFAVAAAFSFFGGETSSNDVWLALIFVLGAILGTAAVMWNGARTGDSVGRREKSKRGEPSLYRLMETMDDAELAALRDRLNDITDHEIPLEELMGKQDRR